MFHPDVVSFRQWYSSAIGRRAQLIIGDMVRRFWPDCKGETMIGLGFSLPYLRMYHEQASTVSMMLRDQGAIYWPADGDNRSLLVQENALPLADNSIQRVLVAHTLEHSQHISTVLREIYRILVPGGKALFIVPNRRGIWSQASATPFGCGQPYTAMQLRHRASLVGFTYVESLSAVYFVPVAWKWPLALAGVQEWIGRLFMPGAGGVIIMEVEKRIYASIPEPVQAPVALFPKPAVAPLS